MGKHRDEAIKCQMLQRASANSNLRTQQSPQPLQPLQAPPSTYLPVKMEAEHSSIVNGNVFNIELWIMAK